MDFAFDWFAIFIWNESMIWSSFARVSLEEKGEFNRHLLLLHFITQHRGLATKCRILAYFTQRMDWHFYDTRRSVVSLMNLTDNLYFSQDYRTEFNHSVSAIKYSLSVPVNCTLLSTNQLVCWNFLQKNSHCMRLWTYYYDKIHRLLATSLHVRHTYLENDIQRFFDWKTPISYLSKIIHFFPEVKFSLVNRMSSTMVTRERKEQTKRSTKV